MAKRTNYSFEKYQKENKRKKKKAEKEEKKRQKKEAAAGTNPDAQPSGEETTEEPAAEPGKSELNSMPLRVYWRMPPPADQKSTRDGVKRCIPIEEPAIKRRPLQQ